MTGVKLVAFSYAERAASLPSGVIVAVQKPLQWAVYDLSRTIYSSCAALFTLSALSQWMSTLNCENVSTNYFPPLLAIAEDELVQSPSLLGMSECLACCMLHLARPTCSPAVHMSQCRDAGLIKDSWCYKPYIDSLKSFIVEWSNPRCTEC